MPRCKISIATAPLRLPLREALSQAMKMNAQGVQLDLRHEIPIKDFGATAQRQLLHFLNERNLSVASAHFPLRSPLIDSERIDQRLQALHQAITFASQLKIRTLTLSPGKIPGQEETTEREAFQIVLSDLATTANQYGVTLCLTPTGQSQSADILSLIDSIKTGPIAVNADPGGWVLQRMSPAAELRNLHAVIGHIDVRDATQDVSGMGRETALGQGQIDWHEFAALLEEMAYPGWLNAVRTAGDNRLSDLSHAVQFLRNLLSFS